LSYKAISKFDTLVDSRFAVDNWL